jgi:hypothetical protein
MVHERDFGLQHTDHETTEIGNKYRIKAAGIRRTNIPLPRCQRQNP